MCQMALLIYAGTAVEDLHDTLADVQRPADIAEQDWSAYQQSKAKLNARFLPKKSNDFALCELVTQKPKNDESIIDFASRLRSYTEKCDFNNWSADKMIKCLVISNMKDEQLRLSCLEDYRLDQVLDKIQLKEDTAAMSKIMGASGGQISSEKVQRVQGKQRGHIPRRK